MKRTLYFKLFIASLPILLVVCIYVITDPFKVIYHYDSFESNNKNVMSLNKDYISTEVFLKNKAKYNYDAYIFGSSRSRYFESAELAKHLAGTSFFHYDASNESLLGVESKVRFIHSKGMKIKYALFIFDPNLLQVVENDKSHLYRKHPLLSGESNFDFQMVNFKDFLDAGFFNLIHHVSG